MVSASRSVPKDWLTGVNFVKASELGQVVTCTVCCGLCFHEIPVLYVAEFLQNCNIKHGGLIVRGDHRPGNKPFHLLSKLIFSLSSLHPGLFASKAYYVHPSYYKDG